MSESTVTSSKALEVFNYRNQQVRTVEQDGQVWFVAKDVCDILGLSNARDAIKSLDDDEKMTVDLTDSHSGKHGGAQFMNVVNEPGLYKLIFRSKKPEAKEFTRWVTHKLLPNVHKYGMYSVDPEVINKLAEKYAQEHARVIELEDKLEKVRASSNLGCVMLAQEGSISLFDAAHFLSQKGIEIGAIRLYKRLRDLNLLCKRKGHQFNQPSQQAISKGLLNAEVCGGFKPIAMVTPKGLEYLTDLFMQEQLPVLFLIDIADKKALAEAE